MKLLLIVLLIISCCLFASSSFGQDSSRVFSIKFSRYKTNLSKKAKATLEEVAQLMRERPTASVAILGHCITENSKVNEAHWDRVHKIIDHLVKKKALPAERFIFYQGVDNGDCSSVDITFTNEPAEVTTPSPHPNLQKKNL